MPHIYQKNGLAIEIDLERPEANIRFRVDGFDWESSPYQTASLPIETRTPEAAWALINDWISSQS